MKITETMRDALASIERGNREGHGHRFPTLEALRKRGYVERHTFDVSRAWYADKSGIHRQHAWAGLMHQWFATEAGRRALQGSR